MVIDMRILLISALTLFLASCCACKSGRHAGQPCIDSSRIRPDAVCPMNWAPVKGCDGKIYGNACQAEAAGVTRYEPVKE